MAGGKDSPMVEFISYMSKQYGDNPTLGEEFMHVVMETHLMKLIDGVAKLITKTDILELKEVRTCSQ